MSRSIVALDPTVTACSVVRITEGEPLPRCGLAWSNEIHGAHTPTTNALRHSAHASQVVDAITANGSPSLVVLAKLVWTDMGRDPSAGRRAGVFWELVRKLSAQNIPVAEVSVLTAQKVVVGAAKFGAKGNNALADEVRRLYPGLATLDDPFRPTTVGLALCGAMAAGIATRFEVTTTRLMALNGDWPQRFKPLATATEWAERYGPTIQTTGDEPLSA